jgi:hypothetical protein
MNTAVTGSVATNDTPWVGGGQWAVVSQGRHGAVVLHPDGTFTYTPEAGYAGQDQFMYKVTASTGEEISATVTITGME